MSKLKNQIGLVSTGTMAAVAVLIALIGIGFFIVRQHKPVTSPAVAPSTAYNAPAATPTQSATTTPPQTVQQYLVISEWGVSAPYIGNGDTLTYALSADKKTANIGSKLMASKDPTCTNRGAGLVQRFAADEKADITGTKSASQLATENPGRFVLVNRGYYQYMHAQSACGTISLADQNTANDLAKAAIAKLQTSN